MLYDCFTFYDELDLLEIRLHELNEVVDYFVLVESTQTFAGQKKQLFFQKYKSRFKKFLNKIIHIKVTDLDQAPSVQNIPPFNQNPSLSQNPVFWAKEYYQRNSIMRGLKKAQPDDVILIGDVDEIPDKTKLVKIKDFSQPCVFEMKVYHYYFNCLVHTFPHPCTRAVSYAVLKELSPQYVRSLSAVDCQVIKQAGWHFSYQKNIRQINQKINSFSHQEYNRPELNNLKRLKFNITHQLDIFDRPINHSLVKIDRSFPHYIYTHQRKFQAHIKPLQKKSKAREELRTEINHNRQIIDALQHQLNSQVFELQELAQLKSAKIYQVWQFLHSLKHRLFGR